MSVFSLQVPVTSHHMTCFLWKNFFMVKPENDNNGRTLKAATSVLITPALHVVYVLNMKLNWQVLSRHIVAASRQPTYTAWTGRLGIWGSVTS